MDIWVVSTFLAIMNNAGLNINVHILVWTYIFQFFWVYAKEWKHPNAHNNSMFNLLENHQTVFQRNCTIFPPAKYQGPSISISLSTSIFFYYRYPKAVQWHLTVVLIYISLMTRQHIEKQRHYFANKGPSSQGYGFSSGRVWMWELDCEEGWALKNWCCWTVVLEKTLESPLDCKEIQPVHSEGE